MTIIEMHSVNLNARNLCRCLSSISKMEKLGIRPRIRLWGALNNACSALGQALMPVLLNPDIMRNINNNPQLALAIKLWFRATLVHDNWSHFIATDQKIWLEIDNQIALYHRTTKKTAVNKPQVSSMHKYKLAQ